MDIKEKQGAAAASKCDNVVYLLDEDYTTSEAVSPNSYTTGSEYDECDCELKNVSCTHANSLYELFHESLLRQIAVTMLQLNYCWTRIGVEPLEAARSISALRMKLVAVFRDAGLEQKRQYRKYQQRLARLKHRNETVIADLLTVIDERTLTELLQPSSVLDGSLRQQIDHLRRQLECLKRHLDKYVREFEMTKDRFKAVMRLTGTTEISPSIAAIIQKRVATNDEIQILQNEFKKMDTRLKKNRQHRRAVSREIRLLVRLIPQKIDNDCVVDSGEDDDSSNSSSISRNSNSNRYVYSEQNRTKLDSELDRLRRAAQDAWTRLRAQHQRLEKLYTLFDVCELMRLPNFIKLTLFANNRETDFSVLPTPTDFFAAYGNDTALTEIERQFASESDRYEALKSERLQELINSVRRQISALLVECFASPQLLRCDERFEFLFAELSPSQKSQQIAAQRLLEQHELELDRLSRYRVKYAPIFAAIGKWREATRTVTECERQLRCVDNYRNRGGILGKLLKQSNAAKKRIAEQRKLIRSWIDAQRKSEDELRENDNKRRPQPSESKDEKKGKEQQMIDEKDDDDDRMLLPFEMYNLRIRDIEREIFGNDREDGKAPNSNYRSASGRPYATTILAKTTVKTYKSAILGSASASASASFRLKCRTYPIRTLSTVANTNPKTTTSTADNINRFTTPRIKRL